MIRKHNKNDLPRIEEIGSVIKENFCLANEIDKLEEFSYKELYVYESEEIIKGFIQIEKHFEIIDLINIAVDPIYQQKNIGSELIDFLIKNVEGKKILLEVRESNAIALNLYKKMGFIEINRRKKYYGDEDAIIMERSI